jgi:hypothetical protein
MGARSKSLERDTSWLAKSNVIDYSLLCGVDRERRELVTPLCCLNEAPCPPLTSHGASILLQ